MNALQDFQELNKQKRTYCYRSGKYKCGAAFVAEERRLCWIKATRETSRARLGEIISVVVSFKPTLPVVCSPGQFPAGLISARFVASPAVVFLGLVLITKAASEAEQLELLYAEVISSSY